MDHLCRNLYAPICFGLDWVTATAKAGSPSLAFEQIADGVFSEKRKAGRDVACSNRLGYVGHSEGGFFHGRRPDGNCIIMSGPHDYPLARETILSATNVSRIDLQVTFWTAGEQPHLGRQAYEQLQRARHKSGRPPTMTLTTGWPTGETLGVNKRVSDYYLRIYDKSAEANLGLPRTVWRYELELKRKAAMDHARALVRSERPASHIYAQVQRWTTNKGLEWPGAPATYLHSVEQLTASDSADQLKWIRENLSKHIAKRVKSHGTWAVIVALGLDQLVQLIPTKSEE